MIFTIKSNGIDFYNKNTVEMIFTKKFFGNDSYIKIY